MHDAIKTVFSIAKSNRDKKVAIVFPTEQYTHAEFCHRIFAQHELYTYLHHVCDDNTVNILRRLVCLKHLEVPQCANLMVSRTVF